MSLAAGLAITGLVMDVAGNIISTIGNNKASQAAEANLRADAAKQQALLDKQTAIATERLTESRDNTIYDINRSQTQAQSGLQAGAAARGLAGSSGTVDAVSSDIDVMAGIAKGRAQTEFSLGMKSVDLQHAQGEYTIDTMEREADTIAANRPWETLGGIFGAGAAAASGAQQVAKFWE